MATADEQFRIANLFLRRAEKIKDCRQAFVFFEIAASRRGEIRVLVPRPVKSKPLRTRINKLDMRMDRVRDRLLRRCFKER